MIMLSTNLKGAIFIVLGIVIICVQQAAAFTPYQFQCVEEGDLGGTCFYNPNTTCSSTTSFGTGTLPSSVPSPYNAIFTAAANEYNVPPAFLAALFYAGEHGSSWPDPPAALWKWVSVGPSTVTGETALGPMVNTTVLRDLFSLNTQPGKLMALMLMDKEARQMLRT